MRKEKIGSLEASVVGLGTWAMGGGETWGSSSERDCINTVHAAIDAGINLIDTAPVYGYGVSEEIVGKAIKGRREGLVIATKCGIIWDDPRGKAHAVIDGKELKICQTREVIFEEVERSLKRLGLEVIDLYQMHWPVKEGDNTPLEESIEALQELKKKGLIKEYGVSNFSRADLGKSASLGAVSDQFRYSPIWRDAEAEIIPYCTAHRLATITYMTLEQGLLTGRIGMNTQTRGAFRDNPDWNPFFVHEKRAQVLDMLEAWKPVAQKYKCTLSQLAIAYTLNLGGITHVLAGSRAPSNILENAEAGSIYLEAADISFLRQTTLKISKD